MKKVVKIFRDTLDNSITLKSGKYKSTLIWLHGLGDESESYLSFFNHNQSVLYQGCKIKLIQAPQRWVTINQSSCNSWYDLRSLNRFTEPVEQVFNLEQVKGSFETIDSYVKQQIEQLSKLMKESNEKATKRIFVGGMSQGGVMSLYYSLSSPILVGGVICLSGYVLPAVTPLRNVGNLPMLLIHGSNDTVIRESEAKNSYFPLLNKRLVEYKSIKGLGHSVCFQEIEMIRNWIVDKRSIQ